MNSKKILVIALATLIILATVTGCRKTGENGSDEISILTSTIYDYTNVESSNESTEDESSSETNATSSDVTSTDSSSTVSVEEPNKNVNPDGIEIYGSGTTDDPYVDTPNGDTHTVKTLSIPAGKSVFYNIYRVGGRIFTINDANAYVVCNGTKYTAQNGKVSFKVVDALASDAVKFEIGNTSSTAKNFTITFADLEGSMANPTIINSIDSEITLNLEEGNEIGHFYKYVAEQKGTLKFYLLGDKATDKGILLATNNRNSAQRSTESSEEGEVKTDSLGTYIELEVEKGDEIIINVGSKPNKRGKYPAAEIKWIIKH
ncbi:MAG: hypothetical protein IKU82_00745 [Clostridia bacterium]|nr:hypothetical protein [Clostridia bacterium]